MNSEMIYCFSTDSEVSRVTQIIDSEAATSVAAVPPSSLAQVML